MKLYAAVLLTAALLGGCDVSKRCVSIWVLFQSPRMRIQFVGLIDRACERRFGEIRGSR
ncbi:hypothetical protein HX797_06315 [Pseudomonas edaphica]|uniref:Lipoprotein n=1 Tax=Pseudomonas edaphica TaxID=2006980 RepID=A0A7Y7RPS8_9PSED|nr:hypothetical protein [Pseudomonas edaphica]NVZ55873.1 hypothetical protein [Pseudomonas edaphica]